MIGEACCLQRMLCGRRSKHCNCCRQCLSHINTAKAVQRAAHPIKSVCVCIAWLTNSAVLKTSAILGAWNDAFINPSLSDAHLVRLGHCSMLC